MTDIERLAAENATLKAALSKRGFTITYSKIGTINKIVAPRRPAIKHTAVTWAKKRGYLSSVSLVKTMTGNKKITLRKMKNMMERAEMIKDGQAYLISEGFKIPRKYLSKIPTYILKNNAFYENINTFLKKPSDPTVAIELEEGELSNESIKKTIDTSISRLKKLNNKMTVAKRNR